MIYVNWYHYHIPKLFGIFSFLINPIFIYLVLKKSKSQMGKYRYLLIFFACFDVAYSVAELLTPIAVINTGYGFVTFITDGPFFDNYMNGQHGVSSRCCFISLSYAILIIHFVYRYLLLFSPDYVNRVFEPLGIFVTLAYFTFHGVSWTWICEFCLAPNDEIRDMIRPAFEEVYHVNSDIVPCLTGQYMILTKISKNCAMSKTTLAMHRQLFKALVVQTCIPIFASFLPTVIAWYAPIFQINLTWWNNYICIIALAAFPFIDPIAVICFIPSYKNTILGWLHFKKWTSTTTPSTTDAASTVSRRQTTNNSTTRNE
ncbi:hypothetical protein B9Z55_017200 [Caenorhabditis nigoni]|uniref:G-protein coupled receptors family 1 profile domain-containing protein n=1 Tax=Caenorhabditis nigoni TaxID=1611254 RepID=A0A2G5T8K5_9PELO|nr:hypothetical protein B9Z55_017200 [Caenorhabditis nigoni]